ncbi:MAG: helix-hairpin-helix domain-containing protein [Thermoanaerobaculia bacterium]
MAQRINDRIASRLDEVAALLEEQGANAFRVQAFRRGAETLRNLPRPVSEIFAEEGIEGLDRLPGIGLVLARSVRELLSTGRLPMLDRLRGRSDPTALLSTVPGIGPRLADRLHHDLGISSLEELEAAASDGRLEVFAGIGRKRLEGIRDCLAARLARVRRPASPGREQPRVEEILDVDSEYRARARQGTLRRIAPRRFNPGGQAWLPVLHTRRGDRHYTALFSNTARAHQLGRTQDWVVLYCDGEDAERQWTVVTELQGELRGRRVVRGREAECAAHYRRAEAPEARPA